MDEAVRRAGGHRIDKVVPTNGIENCDYLIGNHLLELKMIELEPLENPERQKKFTCLFDKLAQEGKHDVESSQRVYLRGEPSQHYWKILGAPVRRHLRKAASQIRATRLLLERPSLRGAAFLINFGADSIDPNSLWNLASHYRHDFSADINALMCFSAIPALALEFNRPCVAFDYEHSGNEADAAFVERFEGFFHSVFADRLGKQPESIDSGDATVQPLRAPFEIVTAKGKTVIF